MKKRIYIAGAGGMLGEAFYNVFKNNYELKCTDIDINENWINYLDFRNYKEYLNDVINFKIFKSKKIDKNLIKLKNFFKDKIQPIMPVGADVLMSKYKIQEGKQLGSKLKLIEAEWVKNNDDTPMPLGKSAPATPTEPFGA